MLGTLGLVLALGWAPSPCRAEEESFSPFRITDVDGSVSLQYQLDRSSTPPWPSAAPGRASAQSDQRAAAVVSVATRGFVYHPNLLALDIGFSTTAQRSRFANEVLGVQSQNSDSRTLYDLSLRATVLRDKPYTGSVFYEHLNPTVSVGPALVMLQESTRKGLQLSLLAPVTPVPMTLELTRQRTLGSGSDRVVDDQADRYSLTADRTFGPLGSTRFRIDGSTLDSQSGSVNLPIVHASSNNLSAGLDTRLQFGKENRYRVSNLITFGSLRYGLGLSLPEDRRDLRGLLDLRARHSAQLQSYASVEFVKADQGALHSRTQTVSGGASWSPVRDLASTLEVRQENVGTTDYSSSSRVVSGSTDYQWSLAGGRARAGYALRYDDRNQSAASLTAPIIGERHALAGVVLVALDRQRVVAGSVRVSNEARTQAFVEGRDYLLSVIGVQTRLQRLVTGDLTDDQTVLVDYAFETGGSFGSSQLDQTINLSWSWHNRISVFTRFFNSTPRLTAGIPLLTLNAVRSTTVGAHAELPLSRVWNVGGNVEHEDHRETILSFKRNAGDLFVQWEEALFGQGGIRVGVRRQRVTYDAIAQDVDLTGYDVRYRVFTTSGLEVQADWSSDTDVGSAVRRQHSFGSLRARWSYRQLLMTLSVTRAYERQGSLQTMHTIGQCLLQRYF